MSVADTMKEPVMGFVRARTSFAAPGRRHVNEGDVVSTDDPVVAGRESLFESLDDAAGPIEQATAAPGERRTTTRKRTSRKRTSKKTAAKKTAAKKTDES